MAALQSFSTSSSPSSPSSSILSEISDCFVYVFLFFSLSLSVCAIVNILLFVAAFLWIWMRARRDLNRIDDSHSADWKTNDAKTLLFTLFNLYLNLRSVGWPVVRRFFSLRSHKAVEVATLKFNWIRKTLQNASTLLFAALTDDKRKVKHIKSGRARASNSPNRETKTF